MYIWRVLSGLLSFSAVPHKVRVFGYRLLGMDLHPTASLAHGVFLGSNKLVMKEDSFANTGCFLDGSDVIYIGEHVRLGPHVKILTGTHTYANSVIRRGQGSVNISRPVILEKGVWIGMGAIVLPGVTVREGCVVAAGSVVSRSTEPNGLYAGNPARRIKDLPIK